MSEEKLSPKEVNVDEILEEAGRFGKFQLKTFLWLIFPICMSSLHANNYIFSARNTNYRCKIPGCDSNLTEYQPHWLENAAPLNDKCSMYPMLNMSSSKVDNSSCPASWFDTTRTVPCEEYVFKEDGTFVEEVGIACQEWKRTLVGTMHSIGTLLVLPAIGYISDRIGRRLALVISCIIEGSLGIVKGLSINYAMFIAFELLEPALGSGVYSSCYVLGLETLPPSTRVIGSCIVHAIYGTSQVLMGLIAWAFPYWRTFLLAIYSPALLGIFYLWLVYESARWLITKKRYQDAIDVLKLIAKTNNKEVTEKTMSGLYYNAENVSKFDNTINNDGKIKNESSYKQLFRSKILLIRVLKCSFWWITCTFSFYGLSINAVFLKGNVFQNFIYNVLMEPPAHVVGYFALTYFGRKRTIFVAFLIGGISCLSFAFIPEDMEWVALMMYLLGKLFVTMAFSSIYLYTSELFPTPLRHSLLATCSMVGRIGSITAPQTPLLTVYLEELPSILFGSTCLISALLMLTSPETLNLRLPETIEEAENISQLKIKK